mgnify:FL=1
MLLLILLSLSISVHAATFSDFRFVTPTGAHGMEIDTQHEGLLLADTFRSMGTEDSRIYRLTESPAPRATGYSGQGISGISAVPGGYLVCDLNASRVIQVTSSFEVIREWSVSHPWNAKVDQNGTPYAITHEGELVRLLPSGKTRTVISGLDAPFDFAFTHQSDEVWISEQGKGLGAVSGWKIPPRGNGIRQISSNYPWANPEGMVFFQDSIWVVDAERGELVEMGSDGSVESVFQGLGIPILVKNDRGRLLVYSNQYRGRAALLWLSP